jgi:cell division protein FtsB
MPRQTRPDSRRRASASRPSARQRLGKRTPTAAQATAQAKQVAAKLPSSGLTTRAAVLGLVLCGLVVSAALPLREMLDQRGEIAEVRQEQAARKERVDALEERRRLLDDPAFLRDLARQRLHFVLPGERQYKLIVPPTQAPAPVDGTSVAPVGADAPWYSQLYGTVQNADRPQPLPSPSPSK